MRLTKTVNLTQVLLITGLLIVVSLLLNVHATNAASITVNSNADSATQDDGFCTLREAINNANDNIDTTDGGAGGDCVAGEAGPVVDTINLPTGTIIFNAGLPTITSSMVIQGNGMNKTILDGNNGLYKMFDATKGIEIHDLEIRAFKGVAIFSGENVGNVVIDNVEIDGSTALADGPIGGVLAAAPSVTISNTYIHDLSGNGVVSVFGISIQTANNWSSNVSVDRVTINNLSSTDSQIVGMNFATGLLDGSLTPGFITADVANSTVANLASGSGSASAVASISAVNGGSSEVVVAFTNTTTVNITGSVGPFGDNPHYIVGGAALGINDSSTVSMRVSNSLVSGSGDSCSVLSDIAPAFGAGTSLGTVNASITSNGGNITDNATCSPYFTQPTDKNNITNLKDFLGPVSNNGGSVPTIALLKDSPAIDIGVTVTDLTTDARGVERPQGTAYDSGAYEYVPNTTSSLAETGQNIKLFVFAAVGLVVVSSAVFIGKSRRK